MFVPGCMGSIWTRDFVPQAAQSNGGTTYHIEDNWAAVPQFFYAYAPEVCP